MLRVPNINNDSSSEASFEMDSVRSGHHLQPPSQQTKHMEPLRDELDDFQPVALCCLTREHKPRVWFIKLMCWPWFERICILVILTNCVTLGMYDPFDKECETHHCKVLETMETCIYAFFLGEMLVKWIAMGLFGKQGYFADSWNKLDCFIVAAGTFELAYGEGDYLSAVRSIRVLRPLRAINRVPSIRILVMLLLDTLPMLGNVLAICFFIFAIFGIIGVQLWQGILRNRCFPDGLNGTTVVEYNLSQFYRPSFDDRDYVCSLPSDSGLAHCNQKYFTSSTSNGVVCNGTFPASLNSSCINWNQYYTSCQRSSENIFYGSISFDNIAIATVAIFQIITLEGWTDIMYKIQDSHSFWNWWYFVVLILLGSYFMTNLCLVVITSQFQETKQRETELVKHSRRSRASVSTLSSNFIQQGCYTQILHYLEHLGRRLKRRVLKIDKNTKRKKVNPCLQFRTRRDNIKSVHHHHHHYHYYHHFVHHPPCHCSNFEHSDSPPASGHGGEHSCIEIPPENEGTRMDKDGKRMLVVPQIQVFAQAATTLYKDAGAENSPEMVSTATANINVGGLGSTASILTYSKTADSVSMATQATAQTINTACSCAVEHREDEGHYRKEMDGSCSSEDNEVHEKQHKKPGCFVMFRKIVRKVVETLLFNRFIMASIFLNTFCMAVEHHGQPAKMKEVLTNLNILFTIIFTLEMLAKIIAFGPYGYIKDAFNLFDGIIVIVSVMDVCTQNNDSGISVLRSFRLLRIFKLVRFMPALQRQLRVMIRTLDNVMTFLALLSLFIFTASILGMHLFGAKYSFPDEEGNIVSARANFDSLFWALVTVFQILTQEDWNVVLYDGMRSTSPWAAFYFLFLMIIGNYILFNLLVAILVEGFADQTENETLILNTEKNRANNAILQLEKDQSHQRARLHEQCSQNIALSWPNINEKLNEKDQHKPLGRSNSVPGSPTAKSRKSERRSSSYLHILTIDTLDGEGTGRTSGDKSGKLRCSSLVDEDSRLVPVIGVLPRKSKPSQTTEKTSWFERRKFWSLYLFSPNNRFRKFLIQLHSNVWFDRVVLFFILLNCVVMAMEEPGLDPQSKTAKFISVTQYIFTAIFTIEMSIKIIALGFVVGRHTYLRSGWNVIDGILVLFSLIDLVVSLVTHSDNSFLGVLRVFRAFRTLRPLRVINRAPELKLVVETLLSSLKPIGNVVLIAATFFTIFGILGVQLFSGKFYSCEGATTSVDIRNKSECLSSDGKWVNNEYNFDHLARALLTLFVFATRDGWVAIMYCGVDVVGVDQQPQRNHSKWNVLYFVAFLLLAGFVVLNMLVGVVVENFHKCCDKFLKEQSLKKTSSKSSNRNSDSFDTVDYESISPARRKIYNLVTHDYFDLAIAIVICINVLFMGLEHYNQPKNLTLFLKYANYVFTLLFIVEAALKIVALGVKNYFRNRWNCMDMIIVVLSVGGIILDELATSQLPMNPTIIRVMRVLRITRVLKLLKTAEGIRSLLDTVGKALPQVANLGLLFILLFFIFGALGMELFGDISCDEVECDGLDSHAHFRNFGYSVLTLFRVATGDNWNGVLKDTINSKRCESGSIDACKIIQNIAPIYFATFVLITQFVLLNVVVAVMMKHLEEAKFIEKQGQFVSNRDRLPRSRPSKLPLVKTTQGTTKDSPEIAIQGKASRFDESDCEPSQNGDKDSHLETFDLAATRPKNISLVSDWISSSSKNPDGCTSSKDTPESNDYVGEKTNVDVLDITENLIGNEGGRQLPKISDTGVDHSENSADEKVSEIDGSSLNGNITFVKPLGREKDDIGVPEVLRGQEDTQRDGEVQEHKAPRHNFKVKQGWVVDVHEPNDNEGQNEIESEESRVNRKRNRRKERKKKEKGKEGRAPKHDHGPKEEQDPDEGYHPNGEQGQEGYVSNVYDLKEHRDPDGGHGPNEEHGPEEVHGLNRGHKSKKRRSSEELKKGRGQNEGHEPTKVREPREDIETKLHEHEPEEGQVQKQALGEDEQNEGVEHKEREVKKNKRKLERQKEKGKVEESEQEPEEQPKLKVQKVLPRLGEEATEEPGYERPVVEKVEDTPKSGEESNSNESDSETNGKQRRIHFHGIRLEPLPSNVTKLSNAQ